MRHYTNEIQSCLSLALCNVYYCFSVADGHGLCLHDRETKASLAARQTIAAYAACALQSLHSQSSYQYTPAQKRSTSDKNVTFAKLPTRFQCRVNWYSRVQHASRLPKALLPGHMVGQLPEAVGDTAQVNAAVTLPSPPGGPIVTPRP